MTSDLDIYRSANQLIRQHGDDARFHAAQTIDEMIDKGDIGGQAIWQRILDAIVELLDTGPKTVH